MQFQHDCPKDKKITALNFFPENLEKYRSTELYDAPLEGSTIFFTAAPPAAVSGIALDQMS